MLAGKLTNMHVFDKEYSPVFYVCFTIWYRVVRFLFTKLLMEINYGTVANNTEGLPNSTFSLLTEKIMPYVASKPH